MNFYGISGKTISPSKAKQKLAQYQPEVLALAEPILAMLDNKKQVEVKFFGRLQKHLMETTGLDKEIALSLMALRLGFIGPKSLHKAYGDEEFQRKRIEKIEARKNKLQVQKQDKAQLVLEQAKRRAEQALQEGNDPSAKGCTIKSYFFFNQPQYLLAIENLLVDYRDVYLDTAAEQYPTKMEWEPFNKSFGKFWNRVVALHRRGILDLSGPGLMRLKRLARLLFIWNFRRYLLDEIVARHARYLPDLYRKMHVAAKFDADPTVIVDSFYEEAELEDEPDDNRGNC